MRRLIGFMTFLTAALVALPALAADAAVPDGATWWQQLLVGMMPHIVEVAGALLTMAGLWVARHYGLKVKREQIEGIVDTAVGFGEQYARRALKEGKPANPDEVKAKAVSFAVAQADHYKVGVKTAGLLEDLVEARLGMKNASKPSPGAFVKVTGEGEGTGG